VAFALSGPRGDWLSQGRAWELGTAAGAVGDGHPRPEGRFDLSLATSQRTFVALTLVAPGGRFRVGSYEGATRFADGGAAHPALDLQLAGHGCNTSTGSFTITTARYERGRLVRLAGRFGVSCLPEGSEATGAFRWAAKGS
jgi:hypothetical protein